MPLTREQFDDLVRGVEKRFHQRTPALRWHLVGWVIVGYVGLLVGPILLGLLALVFFITALHVGPDGRIPVTVFGVIVLVAGLPLALRGLLVRLPPPEGKELTREEAPALHAWLDELTTTLRCSRFHKILIIPDCNAAVVQRPRLGVFGWSRNYLLLGLTLMDQMSPEEFRAVLAHEFAHLSKEHGRFGSWIYRLRITWEKSFEEMSKSNRQGSFFRLLVVPFIHWFWPRFNAHAFVLSRLNEYEADSIAARTTSPAQLASALQHIALHNRQIHETLWPEVWKGANTQAEPPSGVLTQFRDALRKGPEPATQRAWTDEAFRITTTNADTHPCLTDRLRAIGQSREALSHLAWSVSGVASSEALLGPALTSIRSELEQRWHKEAQENWKERHSRATALQDRLSQIDKASSQSSADIDKLWDRARVLLDLQGDGEVRPILQELLAIQPRHTQANFHIGRILLDKNDATGEEHLERAMREDSECIPNACRLLRAFHHRNGRTEKMRAMDARLDQHEKQLAASHQERSSVSGSDTLIPHSLTAEQWNTLKETLSTEPRLARASLVQKKLTHFPEQKLFLLCIRAPRRWYGFPDADEEQDLVNRLTKKLHLPGRLFIFSPRGPFRSLGTKVQAIPDAVIHGGTAPDNTSSANSR